MNDETEKPEEDAPEAEPQGPRGGQRLAEARRERQISVLEIAKELHLDEPKVRALERNDFVRRLFLAVNENRVRSGRMVRRCTSQCVFHRYNPQLGAVYSYKADLGSPNPVIYVNVLVDFASLLSKINFEALVQFTLCLVSRPSIFYAEKHYATLRIESVAAFSSWTSWMNCSTSINFRSLPSLRRGETPSISTSRSPTTSI